MLEICEEKFKQVQASTKTSVLSELAEKARNEKGECIPGNLGYISKPLTDKYWAQQREFRDRTENVNDLGEFSFGMQNLEYDPGSRDYDPNDDLQRAFVDSINEEVLLYGLGHINNQINRHCAPEDVRVRIYAFLTTALDEWLAGYRTTGFSEKIAISIFELLSQSTSNWAVASCALACNHETKNTNPTLMRAALLALQQIESNRAGARLALAKESYEYIRDGRAHFQGDAWIHVPSEFCETLSEDAGLGSIDFRQGEDHAGLREYRSVHREDEILSMDVVAAINLSLLWDSSWVDFDGNRYSDIEDTPSYSHQIIDCQILAFELLSKIPAKALSGYSDLPTAIADGPVDFEIERLRVIAGMEVFDSLMIDRVLYLASNCFAAHPLNPKIIADVLKVIKSPSVFEAKDSRVVTLLLMAAEAADKKIADEANQVLDKNIYDSKLRDPKNYLTHIFPNLEGANKSLRGGFVAELLESAQTNGPLSIAFAILTSNETPWVQDGTLDYLLGDADSVARFSMLAYLAVSTTNERIREQIAGRLSPPSATPDNKLIQIFNELLENKQVAGDLAAKIKLKLIECFDIPYSRDAKSGKVSYNLEPSKISDYSDFLAKLLNIGVQTTHSNYIQQELREKALQKLGTFLPLIEDSQQIRLALRARLENFEVFAGRFYEFALNGKNPEGCLVALGLLVLLSSSRDSLARLAVARLCESDNPKIKTRATEFAAKYFCCDQTGEFGETN